MSEPLSEIEVPDIIRQACDNIRDTLSAAERTLAEICDNDDHDLTLRRVAANAADAVSAVAMMLKLIEALSLWATHMDAKTQGTLELLIETLQIGKETRTDLDERLSQVEYGNVAERELERLKEQLVGDLSDMMANRLRGEDSS